MEDDEEETKNNTKLLSVVNAPQYPQQHPMSPGFQLDPISAFLLFPFLPLVYLFSLHSQLINQMSQPTNKSSGSKVTQIIRDGNTLTIIEKNI